MIDLSGIEYNFLPGLLWWLIPTGIVVAYLWWMIATDRQYRDPWEQIGGVVLIFGGVWLFAGGPIMLGVVPGMYVDQVEKSMTIEQLEEQGFANVSLDGGRKFTASVDGQYFRGALAHDSGHRYQVVELSVD